MTAAIEALPVAADPPFAGSLETHLTVRASASQGQVPLDAWAAVHGWKPIHIVLDRGASRSQPMVSRRRRGTAALEREAARAAAADLAAAGYAVTRIKIEVAADHPDAPQADPPPIEAADGDFDRYFEHHIKLLLPATADLAALERRAIEHGAHLSRNVLRRRDDGRCERFVTRRDYGVGCATSRARLARLVDTLANCGFRIIDVESEYVVYDSDRSLDAGWLSLEE